MNLNFLKILILIFCISPSFVIAEVYPDERILLIRPGILDLGGVTYGQFLTCLQDASFPEDPGPRKVITAVPGTVTTTLNNLPIIFHLSTSDEVVLITSVTAGTNHSSKLGDKMQLVVLFFTSCQSENVDSQQ